jgi:outer membrane protein assembly factor BamB
MSRPLVTEGIVYTVTLPREGPSDIHVLGFDLETGERQFEWTVAEGYDARISAAIDGRVYVVGEHAGAGGRQRLSAVEDGGSVAWTFEAERITAVAAGGDVVYVSVLHDSVVALDAADGRVCARLHPTTWPGGRWLSNQTPVGRPALLEGTVFAPVARFDTDREDAYFEDRVVAFTPDGEPRWESPVIDALFVQDVTAVGETVYVPVTNTRNRTTEPGTSALHALTASSGAHRWTQRFENGSISSVAARGDVVVAASGDLHAFESESGDRRWRTGTFLGPPVIAGDQVFGRRTEGEFVDTVVAVNLTTGGTVASYTFDYQVNRAPVFADGRAVVRTLEYRDTDSGPDHVADRLHALW